jgi:hypothetical protein
MVPLDMAPWHTKDFKLKEIKKNPEAEWSLFDLSPCFFPENPHLTGVLALHAEGRSDTHKIQKNLYKMALIRCTHYH